MSYNGNGLRAKIRATNLAAKTANELMPKLVATFKPWVGKKVLKADGTLMVAVEKSLKGVLPEFKADNYKTPSVFLQRSNYTLAWTVKTCENDGEGHAVYDEAGVYIGNLKNGVLVSLMGVDADGNLLPERKFKDDYEYDEIVRLREICKKAKAAYEEARSALAPFNE